jgi:hypothetical protein
MQKMGALLTSSTFLGSEHYEKRFFIFMKAVKAKLILDVEEKEGRSNPT